MPYSRVVLLLRITLFAVLVLACGLIDWGLRKSADAARFEITAYEAPAERFGVVPEVEEHRMLGAILPTAENLWFFKLQGPAGPVERQLPPLRTLLESVRFGANGKPQWTLPEGWREGAERPMRFATLVIPQSGGALEVSISSLPRGGVEIDDQLMANVNRWMGQLSQPPISRENLEKYGEWLNLPAGKAFLLNITGEPTAGPPMGR